MSYADTRTARYEAHVENIQQLRNEAVDLSTLARAFDYYADDIIYSIPTKGAVADQAAAELAQYAKQRAAACRERAESCLTSADVLEREGLQ